MENSKMEVRIGKISFSGEGEQKWLTEQLDKILGKAEDLLNLSQKAEEQKEITETEESKPAPNLAETSLPKALAHTKKDVDRFLAAALWLQTNGKSELTTKDVKKALQDTKQSPIGNYSQALNYNIKKGHCTKTGKRFYVVVIETEKYLKELATKAE